MVPLQSLIRKSSLLHDYSEAAQLVLQASAMSEGGEVFVLDMGEPVKILELAKSMVRLQGMLPQLDQTKALAQGEIAIHFSGIRPGEKLHEELVVGQKTNPTRHPKITSPKKVCWCRLIWKRFLRNCSALVTAWMWLL